jgi:hypothetical protein
VVRAGITRLATSRSSKPTSENVVGESETLAPRHLHESDRGKVRDAKDCRDVGVPLDVVDGKNRHGFDRHVAGVHVVSGQAPRPERLSVSGPALLDARVADGFAADDGNARVSGLDQAFNGRPCGGDVVDHHRIHRVAFGIAVVGGLGRYTRRREYRKYRARMVLLAVTSYSRRNSHAERSNAAAGTRTRPR